MEIFNKPILTKTEIQNRIKELEVIRDNYISENFIDFTESFLEGLKEDFLHGDFLSLEDEMNNIIITAYNHMLKNATKLI